VHQVAALRPNEWGLHDFPGNVSEWCADHYHDDYVGAPSNGEARFGSDGRTRVVRGGAFRSLSSTCRSALRFPARDTTRRETIGFRTAISGKTD